MLRSSSASPGAGSPKISPWISEPEDLRPPLERSIQTDVAVIGAGLTGLSAALSLCAEGLDVAVLEARFGGFGASGRNAGHLTPTIGKDLPTLLRLWGREKARSMVQLADASVRYTEELIAEHSIDCDYEPVGNVVAAVHTSQYGALDKAAAAAAACSVPGALLEADEMRARGLPRCFERGYLEARGGILDPGRYLSGLRSAALAGGAQLFESSPVVAVEQGRNPLVVTEAGSVRARHVVVATNAYAAGRELPRPLGSIMLPLYVQLFRTAPLSAEQLGRVGWQGREGVYTAHESLENFRLTADNRILGGSKYVRYAYGGGRLPDKEGSVAIRLERNFRKRFRELADVPITDHWGGRIGIGLDFLPALGATGAHGNILYSLAYAGHGLSMATLAGPMLSDLLHGRTGPGRALWERRRIPYPPEPLRWLVFQALDRGFAWLDRRTDRRVDQEN